MQSDKHNQRTTKDSEKSSESGKVIVLANHNPEKSGDYLSKQLAVSNIDKKKINNTFSSFLYSYKNKPENQTNVVWLDNEFKKYPKLWRNDLERSKAVNEIIKSIDEFETTKKELKEYNDRGLSKNNWLADKVKQAIKANGANDFKGYATKIDQAIDQANKSNIKVIYNQNGQISQNPNLDGFIAEHHHANTFNIDAAAKGSEYRAEVLEPKLGDTYGKNTVDIVIKDGNGKIVKKYQSKYGANAKKTEEALKKGDYRGQRKLVPKDQGKDVDNSTETVEVDDVSSEPLSKKEAKKLQREAQEKALAKKYDWSETSHIDIAKHIGKQASMAAALSVGFQGVRVLGRRIWNSLTGRENQTVEEDIKEFVESAIKTGSSVGLTVAATGAITVVIKSGWLGQALKNTPVGRIANGVIVGIENLKILYKFGKGEITGTEALDQAGNTTCSMLGSLMGGAEGASIGAGICSVFGPIGTVIGGITGGIIGGIAGSTVGEAIYEGGKKIVSTIANTAKSFVSGVSNAVSSTWSAFTGLFS